MKYKAAKLSNEPEITTWCNQEPEKGTEWLSVNNFMGNKPEHFPKTKAKIGYDADAVYVAFRVNDQYVLATAQEHQDSVCRDSCVEFFFTPGTDTSKGYFNLEMNCGGTMLFHFQTIPRVDSIPVAAKDLKQIEIYHSMPQNVDTEITDAVSWKVAYRIPFDILKNYCEIEMPAPGVIWRANLYKCADASSHPHWLTWTPVNLPKPDFHQPDFFGILEFTPAPFQHQGQRA